MLLAVTIPQKEVIVDFNINDVKIALLKLPKMLNNCKIINQDDVFKKYDLQFTSFLSLGNKLSVTLTDLSEGKTKIIVDITRMIGTFNQSSEVTLANTDYTKMITALSKLLSNPNLDQAEMTKHSSENSNTVFNIILGVILIIVIIYIFTR
jgi:hypothetical protein